MKISEDQNTVEIDGVKGEFVEFEDCEKVDTCDLCCFSDERGNTITFKCHKTPCSPSIRKDNKTGYFKKVEE